MHGPVPCSQGWKRRDELLEQGAAPVKTLARQLDDEIRDPPIADVIASADVLKPCACGVPPGWL